MSEIAEAETTTNESTLDFLLGGEKSHSQDETTVNAGNPVVKQESSEESNVPDEFDDESLRFEDSTEDEQERPENSPEKGKEIAQETPAEESVDDASLKQEIETLNKRLKDTQSAMHRATEDRARLQKELDNLKSKKENEDDWFSEEDNNRVGEIEQEIQKNDQQISELNEKAALALWDAAAAKVKAEHPDFDKVVYEGLCSKLDPVNGNPQVIALWNAEKDKSPGNAYAFAKKVDDMLLMQNDPEAYRAKIRAEVESEYKNKNNQSTGITGKDGLDLLNSEELPEQEIDSGGSALDYLFKE